jgi:hypothetical protein
MDPQFFLTAVVTIIIAAIGTSGAVKIAKVIAQSRVAGNPDTAAHLQALDQEVETLRREMIETQGGSISPNGCWCTDRKRAEGNRSARTDPKADACANSWPDGRVTLVFVTRRETFRYLRDPRHVPRFCDGNVRTRKQHARTVEPLFLIVFRPALTARLPKRSIHAA